MFLYPKPLESLLSSREQAVPALQQTAEKLRKLLNLGFVDVTLRAGPHAHLDYTEMEEF